LPGLQLVMRRKRKSCDRKRFCFPSFLLFSAGPGRAKRRANCHLVLKCHLFFFNRSHSSSSQIVAFMEDILARPLFVVLSFYSTTSSEPASMLLSSSSSSSSWRKSPKNICFPSSSFPSNKDFAVFGQTFRREKDSLSVSILSTIIR